MKRSPPQDGPAPYSAAEAWIAHHGVVLSAMSAEPELGLVLSEAVTTPDPVPPYNEAAYDGVALHAASTHGANEYGPVRVLARPVSAGMPLLQAEDAVVTTDAVDWAGGHACVVTAMAPGEGRVATGELAAAGSVVLAAGLVLNPAAIGVLARLGVPRVRLIRRPRVALLGNSPMLAACIVQDGAIVEALPDSGAYGADWARAGRFDFVLAIGALPGADLTWGLAIMPGGAAAFGTLDGTPAVVIPGHDPDHAAGAYRLLVRPVLLALAGRRAPQISAKITTAITSPLGWTTLRWVSLDAGQATPTGPGLGAAAAAHGHVLIPANSEGVPAGARVTVWT